MSTPPPMPLPQSQEQVTFDVSPPFFKDGCSLNPSTYNPSTDQVNYWVENSGNILELYGNGFPTSCNPSPLEDIYYSLSGFITLINGNSVLIKPGGFLHQVTGDSSVTWNLDMKFESSSGTVYTFSNLKGIVGSNGLMNITSGTTSNGYGEFKQPTNEGTVQFTNLVDDAGNVFTTYDDAIKLANYDPTTGTSTGYVICSNIASTITQPGTLSGSYSNRTFNGNVTINGNSIFTNCTFNGKVTIPDSNSSDNYIMVTFRSNNVINGDFIVGKYNNVNNHNGILSIQKNGSLILNENSSFTNKQTYFDGTGAINTDSSKLKLFQLKSGSTFNNYGSINCETLELNGNNITLYNNPMVPGNEGGIFYIYEGENGVIIEGDCDTIKVTGTFLQPVPGSGFQGSTTYNNLSICDHKGPITFGSGA